MLLNGGHTQVARIENGKLAEWVNFPDGYDNTNYAEIPYETWTEFNEDMNVIMASDAEGTFGVAGLEDGTYYLLEIKAPNGYNLLEHDLEVTITATTANGQNWNVLPTLPSLLWKSRPNWERRRQWMEPVMWKPVQSAFK